MMSVGEGNFAPVPDEITSTELEVRGNLPRELTGLYLRNGPNPAPGDPRPWHAGNGMVHGIRLERGRALWYRNRYVRTAAREGRIGAGIRGGASSNTHVMAHAGRILTCVEVALPMELDCELATVGPCDFGGVDTAFTAHGKICPGTGDLVGFGYQFARPHLTYYRIDRTGRLAERRPIEIAAPCLMHDFALTEHYAVFFDTPVRMIADWGRGIPFQWQEGQPTRIGLVPRAGGEARWFAAASCQLSHTANAFERDGRVVIDGIRMERFPVAAPSLHRWEVDLAKGLVVETPLDRRPVEFPRVDDRRTGREHRYVYVVEMRGVSPSGMPIDSFLRRYDVDRGASVAKDFGERYALEECVFVPASSGAAEDAGWLLTLRYDRELRTSDLVVLDARDFTGEPVAVVAMPRRVPSGFHGSWVAD